MFNWIPLITGLLPLIIISLCYVIAAAYEHITWCIPFIDGCTSISATGRKPPESYYFRGAMLPVAAFKILYWLIKYRWMQAAGVISLQRAKIATTLGIIAAAFLVIYVTLVGEIGELYQLQRRIGITGFLGLTFLAQLIMTDQTLLLKRKFSNRSFLRIAHFQLTLCVIMLIIGLISIPFGYLMIDIDNILEWNFVFVMCTYFITDYFLWKSTGFKADFSINHQIRDDN